VVFGDLIADFVAPLLTVALQLLSVLNAAGTIFGHILGARACRTASESRTSSNARTGSNAGSSGACCSRTGSGRKLRRGGPAAALQEVGCGAAAGWSSPNSAGESRRHVQEVVHLSGRRPGAGGDTCACRRSCCRTSARRRSCCRARSGRRPRCGARSACGPRPAATYRRRTTGRGRGPRPSAASSARPATSSTTASEDVILREKKDRSDEYQESRYTFHVVTCDLL